MPPLVFLTTLLTSDSLPVYRGDQNQIQVSLPRIEAAATIDGRLSEPAWQQAARLTGFSQYSPADGRPAEETTDILVWYSATAIHFGVRAQAAAGTVRAHLSDRDRGLLGDDYIEFQLGTFNDGRQAFVFAVNPLGVQADGTLIEGNQRRGGAGGGDGDRGGGREQADLSPDFAWDSKGHLTTEGFEVELRIPFKSLRYQRDHTQQWTLQVIRKSAGSGREDTWAPARRGAASFVAQAGRLVGISDIRRGLVLEANPIVTSTISGAPGSAGGWRYGGGKPEFGGNVKWGVTSDLTINGTLQPDFSQVEADASQISPDPRSAIFFQEKRPFFLDGIEYFATPSQTIYTRRIAAPLFAAKFTGRAAHTNFGFLSAVDDRAAGSTGSHPVYNLLRVQRDVGRQSRIGLAYTDRFEGDDYNRVLEVDSRFLFGQINSLAVWVSGSRTRTGGATSTAPAWSVSFNRNGRRFGLNLTARGLDPDFEAGSGFINRGDIAQLNASPSVTFFGPRGSMLERLSISGSVDRTWIYDDLFAGRNALERKHRLGVSLALRGGWSAAMSVLAEVFSADHRLYQDHAVELPRLGGGLDTIPYGRLQLDDIPNLDLVLNFDTPQIHGFDLNGFVIVGRDENFFEWSPANISFGRLGLAFRPTEKLRFDGSLAFRTYNRRTDGSRVGHTWIPRLKVEYQASRAVFVRVVGEYASDYRDDLRDDSRTGAPVLIRGDDGVFQRSLALRASTNDFRVDWLFSYQPTPGTVFFAGYGSSLVEDRSFRFRGLSRARDGFFVKLSYLLRL